MEFDARAPEHPCQSKYPSLPGLALRKQQQNHELLAVNAAVVPPSFFCFTSKTEYSHTGERRSSTSLHQAEFTQCACDEGFKQQSCRFFPNLFTALNKQQEYFRPYMLTFILGVVCACLLLKKKKKYCLRNTVLL